MYGFQATGQGAQAAPAVLRPRPEPGRLRALAKIRQRLGQLYELIVVWLWIARAWDLAMSDNICYPKTGGASDAAIEMHAEHQAAKRNFGSTGGQFRLSLEQAGRQDRQKQTKHQASKQTIKQTSNQTNKTLTNEQTNKQTDRHGTDRHGNNQHPN